MSTKLTPTQIAFLERCAMTGEQIATAGPRRFAARTVATLTDLGLIERSKRIGNVLTADGWAWLLHNRNVTVPADIERRAARIANVLADWKGKEIVLKDGRRVVVCEHRHGIVRLAITAGPNTGESVWRNDAEIWYGLEHGEILTPGQTVTVTPIDATPAETIALLNDLAAEQDRAVSMLDTMLTVDGRTPESIAYVARAALRLMADSNGPLSLSGLALAELDRRHPARPVTVTHKNTDTTWHLVNRHGHQVEVGEYTTDTGLRFTIAQNPDASCDRSTGEPVRVTVMFSGSERVAWIKAETLVKGWHWERAAA